MHGIRHRGSGAAWLAGVVLVAWAGVAAAGLDIDLGASVRVGDDTDLFLAISSRYFDRDPGLVRDWRTRYRNPDDLAVAFFLAARSGRDPEFVFELRRGGLSWWDVGRRLDLRPDVWFVPCDCRPGPPYGRAYGYWRKHQRDPGYRFSLRDAEVRDLVALRMLHEYYGMEPRAAMKWREGRRNVESLMAREYRRRHPLPRDDHGRGHDARGRDDRGRDRDKPHGKKK